MAGVALGAGHVAGSALVVGSATARVAVVVRWARVRIPSGQATLGRGWGRLDDFEGA